MVLVPRKPNWPLCRSNEWPRSAKYAHKSAVPRTPATPFASRLTTWARHAVPKAVSSFSPPMNGGLQTNASNPPRSATISGNSSAQWNVRRLPRALLAFRCRKAASVSSSHSTTSLAASRRSVSRSAALVPSNSVPMSMSAAHFSRSISVSTLAIRRDCCCMSSGVSAGAVSISRRSFTTSSISCWR